MPPGKHQSAEIPHPQTDGVFTLETGLICTTHDTWPQPAFTDARLILSSQHTTLAAAWLSHMGERARGGGWGEERGSLCA